MPKETRDYVDFIVFGRDVPDTSKTSDAFNKAYDKFMSFTDGGPVRRFDGGAPGYLWDPANGVVPEVTPTYYAGRLPAAVATAELPAKFNGSQAAARGYAEGYQWGKENVTRGIDEAGKDIYRAVDAVTGFIPGVPGMVNWLGHMGANAATGQWDKVAGDLAMAGALAGVGNIAKTVEVGKNASYVPKITSKATVKNRVIHPIETYRFAKTARDSKNILPEDIHRQAVSELARSIFHNRPIGETKYWLLNRKPAINTLSVVHGWDQSARKYVTPEFFGLGDPNATTNFSRAHEFGHLVWDAAAQTRNRVMNFPPAPYEYVPGETIFTSYRPGKIAQEYFADVFGNTLYNDMHLDPVPHIANRRYGKVKNQTPEFEKY